MAATVIRSLQYRLAAVVSLGLLIFAILAGGITFYFEFRAQIAAADDVQRQLVRTVQAQAEVAAFASNAEIAKDVLEGLIANESTMLSHARTALSPVPQTRYFGGLVTPELNCP